MVDSASVKLDEIVKFKENAEKGIKKQKIESIWNNKNFELFPIDKVFNPKWLNKTTKLSEVETEIDAIIQKTYAEIKQIEKYADSDIDVCKAFYLDCLSIGDTFDYLEQLKKNREIAQKEAKEREEREHNEIVAKQKSELWHEESNFEKNQSVENLADLALATANGEEVKKPSRSEFVLTLRCFDEDLLKLKQCMNELGIEFTVQDLDF